MSARIKTGLIGLGRMGRFYLEEMQKSGEWDIRYICDVNPGIRALAGELSPGSRIIEDEQVIFEDPEIEVVGLFTLADSRLEQIRKAVHYGKHIGKAHSRYRRAGVGGRAAERIVAAAQHGKSLLAEFMVPPVHEALHRAG